MNMSKSWRSGSAHAVAGQACATLIISSYGCAMRFTFLRRAVAGALAITAVAAAPAAAQFSPGSAGLGDPFFPFAGNGGYDVQHYFLDLNYVRTGNQMD